MSRRFLLASLLLATALVPWLPASQSTAGGLADDGRSGVVLAVQGTALVRPAGRFRWTPLTERSVLFPGDLVRTDSLGAHALEVQLKAGGKLILGPGTVLELPMKGGVRLMRGELEAASDGKQAIALSAPGAWKKDVKGTAWLRSRGKETKALEKEPKWLRGYRASAGDEWMGSLLANVDGREVPLAVGYHKVGVEVRDQIARTTVEQSFVNTTDNRLEGVFYFPLPADASISGFGMWIHGELVEADIVEKQRARQIYEDILRRKKDPGLLEWEGGNLFKARVFPIEPHSEKRIRIRYTQVLPLEGSTFRYRYALRSELLRTKPLRQLDIEVKVVSSRPLTEVSSPTHEIRIQKGADTAVATFTAQEYSPERDFELAVSLDGATPVTAVPHRRGEDGYLMLQLAAPDEGAGGWQRDLMPEGKPLDVLFVADTSGSMDDAARKAQARFIRSTLSLLGEADTFRVLAFDAKPVWIEAERLPVREDTMRRALDSLGVRRSLGWSDLDAAFTEALAKADDGTTVVYVGDGIGTTGDADPVALADRLRRIGESAQSVVHAVAPSSTYEAPVLEALATIGGGSVRSVGVSPAQSAYSLLSEVARPAVKDLRVQIEGLRTARVYPSTLPNLPAGQQHVVLGRFLPSDKAQTGRITMTGTLLGKPVRYSTKIEIPPADVGNSFLPRLWARKHLDALLAQGRTAAVKEEVVQFSERFGIMTPYTSFLVLESDEDREKYGVARRVKMRDGERFFADAADKARLEARRNAMKQAGTWRLGLRRTMLREIAGLGRGLPIPYPHTPYPQAEEFAARQAANDSIGIGGGAGGAWGGKGGSRGRSAGADKSEAKDGFNLGELRAESAAKESEELQRGAPPPGAPKPMSPAEEPMADRGAAPDDSRADRESIEDFEEADADMPFAKRPAARKRSSRRSSWARESLGGRRFQQAQYGYGGLPGHRYIGDLGSHLQYRTRHVPAPISLTLLGWPGIGRAPDPDTQAKPKAPDWDAEILALVNSTWRRDQVIKGEGAFHFVYDAANLHPTRGTATSAHQSQLWVRSDAFYALSGALGQAPYERWVYDGKRGALAAAFRLARTRDAKASDGTDWGFPFRSLGRFAPALSWRTYTARIASRDGDLVTVVLKAPGAHENETQLVIDGKRGLLVEQRELRAGKLASRSTWSKPVEAGGTWWPTAFAQYDDKGRQIRKAGLGVIAVERAKIDTVAKERLAAQADVVTVHGPLPTVDEAKQSRHDRAATFVDEVVLALHFASTQQWTETWQHWDAAAAKESGKPGLGFASAVIMQRSRNGETFKKHLGSLATYLASLEDPRHTTFLAPHLQGLASGVLGYGEQLELLERFEKAWIAPKESHAALRRYRWLGMKAQYLWNLGRQEDARAVRKVLAEAYPHDVHAQVQYAGDLWSTGRRSEALDYVGEVLAKREPWLENERENLYVHWTDRLWQARQLDRLQAALHVWLSHEPKTATPYLRFNSLLYLLGRIEDADRIVTDTLGKRLTDDDASPAWLRLDAAARTALGHGWHFNIRHVERMWWNPLRDLVLHYARADLKRSTPAEMIMGDWRFRRTQAWRDVREGLRKDLAAGTLDGFSLARLGRYLRWLPWSKNQVDPAFWRKTTDAMIARFQGAETERDKDVLASYVMQLLDQHGETDEAIAFLRSRMAAAKDARKHTFAVQIWDRQLRREYAPEREDEVFRLLGAIADPELSDEQRRSFFATRVRQLADRLYTWRREDAMGPPASRKDLTRAALKLLQTEAKAKARRGVVSRLKAAALDAPAAAREWLQIERIGYAVQLGENLGSVMAEAAGLLEKSWMPDGNPLDRIVRERAAVVLAYGSTRRAATEEQIDGVLKLLAAGTKAQDALLEKDDEAVALLDWRYQTFRLLTALDRVEPLEKALAAWIVPSKVESRWRIALGYVKAETGRLSEAARQFEAVEAADELGRGEYKTLADWYLVMDEDEKREDALLGSYKKTDEWTLANLLSQYQNRATRRNGVPEDMDPEALRVLRVLMRKSQWPANHIWRINNFYRAVKDFRLLESLVDGLTGHTKEAIYNFLQRFRQITSNIHEEATCDALVERIEAVSKEDGLTALDRRALMLLTALVEQRASEVPETDPTHEARALAALRAAQQGDWQSGERKLMADFLGALRFPTGGPFVKEQMAQLRALFDAEPASSSQRLWIGQAYASALWGYKRYDEAIDLLAEALQGERGRTRGVLTSNGDGPFNTLIDWLENRKRFRDGETRLLAEMRSRKLPSRVQALQNKLFRLYANALYHRGSTSLGSGRTLFDAARTRILGVLEDDVVRANPLVSTFSYLHVAANHGRAITDAGQRLRTWSKEGAPAILARLPLQAHNHAATIASSVRQLLGPNGGLEVLLDHHDRQSTWIARVGYDVWNQQHYVLARWRYESHQPLGSLEPRLWALVEKGLERKLVTGDNRGSRFWTPSNKWYWGAKRSAFNVVATRVLELHESEPAILYRVARFQRALGYRGEAISTLQRALERELADVRMRWTLVSWLHKDGRNKEALPLVAALVADHPENLRYWRLKIDVHGGLGQTDALALTLKQAEAWYRENDKWSENVAAGLGEEAVQHQLAAEGVRLYQEAIELRIAARNYRGGRDTRLARYYRILAQGLGGLGKTEQAVRAVSASLVAGSRSRSERNRTVNTLRQILSQAKDLDAWATAYDAEVDKTGLDATPIRKAIASAYGKRDQYQAALRHWLAAREVDPRDAEVHTGVVDTYDRLGNAKGAIEALFGSIRLAPHNLDAYTNLAGRYAKQGSAEDAERALTTLVEITPNDAAGHQRLAEIREEQKRLDEAAVQWRQVVRTRALEPTGYLGLVRVLIRLGKTDEARRHIDHLMKTDWERRFGDVRAEAARLLRELQG